MLPHAEEARSAVSKYEVPLNSRIPAQALLLEILQTLFLLPLKRLPELAFLVSEHGGILVLISLGGVFKVSEHFFLLLLQLLLQPLGSFLHLLKFFFGLRGRSSLLFSLLLEVSGPILSVLDFLPDLSELLAVFRIHVAFLCVLRKLGHLGL